jgi:hypothetical protein
MSLLGVNPVKDHSVAIAARADGAAGALVEMSGALRHREPGPLLAPFFEQLHQALVADGRRALTVDIRDLRFMNSASFKHFVAWLKTNSAQPPDRRYKIHFRVNPVHHWQQVSIDALSYFSVDGITIERVFEGRT